MKALDERAPWSPPRVLCGVRLFRAGPRFCPFCRFVVCSCCAEAEAVDVARRFLGRAVKDEVGWRAWVTDHYDLLPWACAVFGGRWLTPWSYGALLSDVDDWSVVARPPEALRLLLLRSDLLLPLRFINAREVLAHARSIVSCRPGYRAAAVLNATMSPAITILRARGEVSLLDNNIFVRL